MAGDDDERWSSIRAELFGDAAILEDDWVELEVPDRAEHAAIVPVSIRTRPPGKDARSVRAVWLVVDENPSPVVGKVSFAPLASPTSLSTRIRVNQYSQVRAIAQLDDQSLHMDAHFVKASGGCSAPSSTSDAVAEKRRGKMKLRQRIEDGRAHLQLLISHPNHSGLQINQVNRQWIPPDYVNDIVVRVGDQPVFSFSGGISMSENPSMSFELREKVEPAQLSAEVGDSEGRRFSETWPWASKSKPE